jgi:cyclophilin family peptidyl-prolyl cis-trans isomerase
MKPTQKLTLILVVLLIFISCKKTTKSEVKDITETRKTIEMVTDYGTIVIELYNETPKHRDNFIKFANEGVFDSLLFHRVINTFMIQGGDTDSKYAKPNDTLGGGGLDYTVDAEFHPDLFHKKGVLAAARGDHPERASSSTQFYIVQGRVQNDSLIDIDQGIINDWLAQYYIKKDSTYKGIVDNINNAIEQKDWEHYTLYNDSIRNLAKSYTKFSKYTIPEAHREVYRTLGGTPHLDQNYTVFGEVVKGLEIIDSIASVNTNALDRPLIDVRIQTVAVKTKK